MTNRRLIIFTQVLHSWHILSGIRKIEIVCLKWGYIPNLWFEEYDYDWMSNHLMMCDVLVVYSSEIRSVKITSHRKMMMLPCRFNIFKKMEKEIDKIPKILLNWFRLCVVVVQPRIPHYTHTPTHAIPGCIIFRELYDIECFVVANCKLLYTLYT